MVDKNRVEKMRNRDFIYQWVDDCLESKAKSVDCKENVKHKYHVIV